MVKKRARAHACRPAPVCIAYPFMRAGACTSTTGVKTTIVCLSVCLFYLGGVVFEEVALGDDVGGASVHRVEAPDAVGLGLQLVLCVLTCMCSCR